MLLERKPFFSEKSDLCPGFFSMQAADFEHHDTELGAMSGTTMTYPSARCRPLDIATLRRLTVAVVDSLPALASLSDNDALTAALWEKVQRHRDTLGSQCETSWRW